MLQQKLPAIGQWIEHTLASHAAQAHPVTAYGFSRLPQYYPPEILTTSLVVEVPRVPIPPLAAMGLPEFATFEQGDYAGITYLHTYFAKADTARSESLHFHELVHVIQWQHLGLERFLMAYAIGFLAGGGYRNNPLEQMAYDLQARFERDVTPFDPAPIVCQRLDRFISSLPNSIS